MKNTPHCIYVNHEGMKERLKVSCGHCAVKLKGKAISKAGVSFYLCSLLSTLCSLLSALSFNLTSLCGVFQKQKQKYECVCYTVNCLNCAFCGGIPLIAPASAAHIAPADKKTGCCCPVCNCSCYGGWTDGSVCAKIMI
jgi:hypothetical protein